VPCPMRRVDGSQVDKPLDKRCKVNTDDAEGECMAATGDTALYQITLANCY